MKSFVETMQFIGALFCIMIVALFMLLAFFGKIESSVDKQIDRSYNDSKPANMSRQEWNYVGNAANDNGYSESEAKQIGEAISKFKANK